MGIARVQGAHGNGGLGTGSTFAVTAANKIAAGHAVCGLVCCANTATINSVTDDAGNTYNLEAAITDSTNHITAVAFSLGSILGSPKTITAHFSATVGNLVMVWDEYSDILLQADPRDPVAHTGQLQSAPGTGSNAILSGSKNTSVNGELIWGAVAGTGLQVTSFTAGTTTQTYTNRTSDSSASANPDMQTEDAVQSSKGSTQVSFTQSAAGATICFMIALMPANPYYVTCMMDQ